MSNFDDSSVSSFEPDFDDVISDEKRKQKTDYMREYMRDYRLKQKQKQDEQRHCISIGDRLCDHKEVEELLLQAINALINVINMNVSLVGDERIQRINDRSNNIIDYGRLIVETVQELVNNCQN